MRPAVVVQADFLNGLIDDTILVQITGRRFGISGTEGLLDPAVETRAGLTKVCVANCSQPAGSASIAPDRPCSCRFAKRPWPSHRPAVQ